MAQHPETTGQAGRHPEPEKSKAYFTIGTEVEKEILAHVKTDRYSIVAARRLVSIRRDFLMMRWPNTTVLSPVDESNKEPFITIAPYFIRDKPL